MTCLSSLTSRSPIFRAYYGLTCVPFKRQIQVLAPVPLNVTYLETGSLQMASSYDEVLLDRAGTSCRNQSPRTKRKVCTETQREERQVKLEAAMGLQAQDCQPPAGAGKEVKNRFSPRASRRNQAWSLDFGLPEL